MITIILLVIAILFLVVIRFELGAIRDRLDKIIEMREEQQPKDEDSGEEK